MGKSSLMKKVVFVASVTGALAALNYHINNENNKNTNIITDKKPDVERLNFKWKYGNISYNKYGSGSPLVLIHELKCGSSNIEWNKIYESLGKNHTLYIIDLLGCGLSDKPYITYTNFLYVQLINDFITEIIGEPADIVASGNSSAIAAMTNQYNGANINKMIFINPDSSLLDNPNTSEGKKVYEYLVGIPVFGTSLFNYLNSRDNMKKNSSKKFVNPELEDYYENSSYVNTHYDSSKSKYLFASMENNLTEISIKNAIINGEDKILILCGESNEKKDTIIGCYTYHNEKISTKIIPDSNGYPHIENVESTSKTIGEFL